MEDEETASQGRLIWLYRCNDLCFKCFQEQHVLRHMRDELQKLRQEIKELDEISLMYSIMQRPQLNYVLQ